MEEYKGFFIDEDLSDHSVTVRSKEWNINYSTGNSKQAKAYVDGFMNEQKESIFFMKLLSYEISSHWLSGYIGWAWGQNLLSNYLIKKTKRKHKKYQEIFKK